MLSQRHKSLIKQGDELFGKRLGVLNLWQEIADNFYVERADFTTKRSLGDDFAEHLDTSYPIMARRDLGDAFDPMLRASDWFDVGTDESIEKEDDAARMWLEEKTKVQRRAMYDSYALFKRATKQCDHDYAAFGQGVISTELYKSPINGPHLLYRNWHLRDVAWGETIDGQTSPVHRKWKPTAMDMAAQFPGKVHQNVKNCLKDNPFETFEVRHIVVRSADYEGDFKTPYVSVYIDVDNEHLLEEKGSWTKVYTIPRWQTVSGSQYAFSPSTVAALPDARLLQSMTYTLLTAGEMAVEPAMIGVQEALRSDLQIWSGGFTAIDARYDERLGEVLRPLNTSGSIPIGFEMVSDSRQQLAQAFFLNRLNLPSPSADMTAYEVSERVREFIRAALPLFEPMELDYNAPLCEDTFELLLRNGAFGPLNKIPQSIGKRDIRFKFKSPIKTAEESEKGNTMREALVLTEAAAPLDPLAPVMLDARIALRDALQGIGVPAKWLRDKEAVAQIETTKREQEQIQALTEQVSQGAQIAEQIGNAGSAVRDGFTPDKAPQ